jgi:hypothetical protein
MAFGNSTGPFNTGFGDVRGKNGIIIAAPSSHSKQDNFGLYKWQRTGQVPELPLAIALRLPQVSHESAASFNSAEVKEFLFVHSENQYPKLLRTRLEYFSANPPSINSRHTAFQRLLCLILKDAIVGMYPAETALIECQALFNLVKRPDEQTSNEFEGMACWAMAQVNMMSDDEKLMHGMSVAPHLNPEIMKWINSLDN